MEFKKETLGLYKLRKHNYFVTMEGTIYRHDDLPMFGLVSTKDTTGLYRWGMVHIPSERMIILCFNDKAELEEFVDFLGEIIDLNSLFLCHPQFEFIEEQIKYDVEIGYKKFIRKKRMT